MTDLFASGRIIDWILAGMVLEGFALAALHGRTGRGVAPRVLFANLGSGMCVLLAMRLVLGGAWWGFASAALLFALIFHVVDLAGKWR
jgi:hypothetical protein